MYENDTNVLLAGDHNTHHPLWNDEIRNNRKGIILADIISDSNFVVLNDGSHTYEQIHNNSIYKSV